MGTSDVFQDERIQRVYISEKPPCGEYVKAVVDRCGRHRINHAIDSGR